MKTRLNVADSPWNPKAKMRSLIDPWLPLALLGAALGAAAGCGTLASGKKWGEDATMWPGWERVDKAAFHAAVSPGTLAARNFECLEAPGWAQTGATAGLCALTAATGWSSLEARRHYPSDVPAGMALGHFFGAFVNDAFLGVREPRWFFAVEPGRQELLFTLHRLF